MSKAATTAGKRSVSVFLESQGANPQVVRAAERAQEQAVGALDALIERATDARVALRGNDAEAWTQALGDAERAGASGTLSAQANAYQAAVSRLVGIVDGSR